MVAASCASVDNSQDLEQAQRRFLEVSRQQVSSWLLETQHKHTAHGMYSGSEGAHSQTPACGVCRLYSCCFFCLCWAAHISQLTVWGCWCVAVNAGGWSAGIWQEKTEEHCQETPRGRDHSQEATGKGG